MSGWTVDDVFETELEGVREVVIRIVGGDVAVTAADGPARLAVRREEGPPVDVRLADGVLTVSQPDHRGSILQRLVDSISARRLRAIVVVSVPSRTRVDVGTVSAPVVVSGIDARTRVNSVSGDLTLSSLGEEVNVKTVSGDVEARGISADLKAKTVSGDVTVADGSCTWLDAKTVSGEVTLDLALDPVGTYSMTTVSGTVALRTDADPSLLVDAQSVSGEVVSDFDLGWEDTRPGRRRIRRRLGEGGARLQVKTVSGDLRLLRRAEAA